ncbi:MAG: hypothetical protein H7829_00205 [Magnetococcus sp. THC-1_WYH]
MKWHQPWMIVLTLVLMTGCVTKPPVTSVAPVVPIVRDVPNTPTVGKNTLEESDLELESLLDPGPLRWHEGDTWLYGDGYHLAVGQVRGTTARLDRLDKMGDWVIRDGLFKIGSKTGDSLRKLVYRSPDPSSLFPLEKGKSVLFLREYKADDQLRRHKTSWRVFRREKVTVPAGSFHCWVMEWKTRSLDSDWTGVEKWWYSPLVGNYVRMEYQYGKNKASSRVLVRFTPTKR